MPKYFESRERDNGESFTCIRSDAPEWVTDVVHACHGDMLPCDWVYEECRAAFEAYEAGDIVEMEVHDYTDTRVDVYTRAIYQWASDMCLSGIYADAEADANDSGLPEEMEKRLQVIQYYAIDRIANLVIQACEKHASDSD